MVDYTCIRCGRCCKPHFGKVFSLALVAVGTHDQERIAKHLGISVEALCERYRIANTSINVTNEPCSFLDLQTNLCTVHDAKPITCARSPSDSFLADQEGARIYADCCPGYRVAHGITTPLKDFAPLPLSWWQRFGKRIKRALPRRRVRLDPSAMMALAMQNPVIVAAIQKAMAQALDVNKPTEGTKP